MNIDPDKIISALANHTTMPKAPRISEFGINASRVHRELLHLMGLEPPLPPLCSGTTITAEQVEEARQAELTRRAIRDGKV